MMLHRYRPDILLLCLASVTALTVAYGLEMFFSLMPCQWCYFERYAYYAVIICAMLSVLPKVGRYTIVLTYISMLGLLAVSALHISIEQHWVSFGSSCESDMHHHNFEEFVQAIEKRDLVPCDQPTANFLGISLAGWNFFYAWGALLISIIMRWQRK
jgi:disulfide bond formation protein DsbB